VLTTVGRFALVAAVALLAGCGGVAYPPAHETRAQHRDRIVCEALVDGKYSHGSDAWKRRVLRCVRDIAGA
jgi:hypothetical protein